MRLAAQAKAGFYPTPPRVTEMIAGLMQARSSARGETTLRILDPCCGAGIALAQLAAGIDRPDGAAVETYGVELQAERAETAKYRLDHVLGTDLFQTSIANGAFGLLYLNPPYDFDSGEEKRLEQTFLRHCTRYLAEHGLLVFVIPRRRLAESARYLASHYARLRCWAFPGPEREAFDQVVVTGTRKAEVQYDQHAAVRLQEVIEGNAEELTLQRYPSYNAPATAGGEVLFATRTVDPVAAAAEARRSGLWTSTAVTDLLWPAEDPSTRPLMPLRPRGRPCAWRRVSSTTSRWRRTGAASSSRGAPRKRCGSSRPPPRRRSTASGCARPSSSLDLDIGEITDIAA